ncbi:MAG: ATP-binding protein [Maribacter sp.]
MKGGLVGNFVVIEGDQFGFLGKILELNLPEKERLQLSEKSFNTKEFHPTGKVEILLSFEIFDPSKIDKGLNSLPVIGAKVFICSSEFIRGYFKGFGVNEKDKHTAPTIQFGHLTYDKSTVVEISQQAIFGRHCAVVGTTGGGKSYTTSKLLEGIIQNEGKTILIDATGEYDGHDKEKYSAKSLILADDSYFPYSRLTIGDLFVLFRPAGQVQQPLLLEAIKSLKIVHCLLRDKEQYQFQELDNLLTFKIKTKQGLKDLQIFGGCIRKQGNLTAPFNMCYHKYVDEIEDNTRSHFDIHKLVRQIGYECFQIFGDSWSKTIDNRNYGNSTSLLMRVNNVLNDDSFKNIFGFKITDEKNLIGSIESFLELDNNTSLLRIGFEKVPFNFQAREILANSIGNFLLNQARQNKFKSKPLVLFVDEAHQFLNKSVKDDYFELTELNAFNSIAKECRKYGLFLCIATQMPRDIPNGTLSQIGTFITHRLINYQDKEAVANACSTASRETLSFLPVLGAGEAILMGIDFPMPVILKVNLPKIKPNSDTPLFKLKSKNTEEQ